MPLVRPVALVRQVVLDERVVRGNGLLEAGVQLQPGRLPAQQQGGQQAQRDDDGAVVEQRTLDRRARARIEGVAGACDDGGDRLHLAAPAASMRRTCTAAPEGVGSCVRLQLRWRQISREGVIFGAPVRVRSVRETVRSSSASWCVSGRYVKREADRVEVSG